MDHRTHKTRKGDLGGLLCGTLEIGNIGRNISVSPGSIINPSRTQVDISICFRLIHERGVCCKTDPVASEIQNKSGP